MPFSAMARVLGSAEHALRFLEALERRLGARAHAESSDEGRVRRLYVRDVDDPHLVAFPPVLTLTPTATTMTLQDVQLEGAAGPHGVSRVSVEIEMPPASKPSAAAPCELRIAHGRATFTIAYDEKGRFRDAQPSRGGPRSPLLLRAREFEGAVDEESLAALVLKDLDAALPPTRFRAGEPHDMDAVSAARVGLAAIRRVLFEERTEAGGFASARCSEDAEVLLAPTRAEALARVDAALPAVVVPYAPLPTKIPAAYWEAGYHRWTRMVGEIGEVSHVLAREGAATTTMVGEAVVPLVDPFRLDEELDAADRETRTMLAAIPDARPPADAASLASYRVVDDAHRRRVATDMVAAQAAPQLSPWEVSSPDDLTWQVARYRKAK